jgi:hypothetical protein
VALARGRRRQRESRELYPKVNYERQMNEAEDRLLDLLSKIHDRVRWISDVEARELIISKAKLKNANDQLIKLAEGFITELDKLLDEGT